MIPLIRPQLDFAAIEGDLRTIFGSGMLTNGQFVAAFERAVAAQVGVRHAFSTTSATTALHLTLAALGVGPDDEVVCSDFSFPATGNAIVQCGATPVFVDCTPGGFAADPDGWEGRITPRTKVLLPVDVFGQPTDMQRLGAVAERHGLPVLVDAACSIGASFQGKPCGAWGYASCFSFHPRKIITTGEGGMITTNDDALADRIRLLRNHGGRPDTVGLVFEDNGYNYRLTEMQAAMGLSQLRRLDAIVAERVRVALLYREALRGRPGLSLPGFELPEGVRSTYQSFVILLDDGIDRDRVVARMREQGVETTLGTYAMHAQPAFARFGYKPGDLPHAWRAQRQSLTLPLFAGMDEALVGKIVDALLASIAG